MLAKVYERDRVREGGYYLLVLGPKHNNCALQASGIFELLQKRKNNFGSWLGASVIASCALLADQGKKHSSVPTVGLCGHNGS